MQLSHRILRAITVGIRREDPQRIWERRAPLTPDAVHHLVSQSNVNVQVEHCDRRVFQDREYIEAGATIVPPATLDAHIILGIKETPLNELITSPSPYTILQSHPQQHPRTHLMFSHTAKGQPYNTPLLAKFVRSADHDRDTVFPRLIDYELLTNPKDEKRTVGFGWFAGVAGVLESLSAMAHSHLEIGIASPFLYTPRPHTHSTIESLRAALHAIGDKIGQGGTPPSLGPFVIGLTGNGNVSQGCLSMLSELPIEKVTVKDLYALVTSKAPDLRKIYLVHALPQDYLIGLDGRTYDREHYYSHPQSYRSTFCQSVAPYLTLLLNGAGWSPSFPRLMTNEQLTVALDRAHTLGGARFTNIGDISCDVEGGLQFLTRSTTLSTPFYKTRPTTLPTALPSIQFMSVDILPTSLPLDASTHFSKVFLPYLESLIRQYRSGPRSVERQDEYGVALAKATIATDGRLVGRHKWLQEGVDKFYAGSAGDLSEKNEHEGRGKEAVVKTVVKKEGLIGQPGALLRKKKLLMLGSGMVAGPAVEQIAKRGDVQLLIASDSLQQLEELTGEHLNVQYRLVDISDHNLVSTLIEESDVVISLLPASLHVRIAELCVTSKKHLVTASYLSLGMSNLDKRARAAGVLLLSEIGLDPGIDHCSAISLTKKIYSEDKDIVSFTSFCGGLPAPEVPFGPLRYKFSWSPRAVLLAALNAAKFRLSKQTIDISSEDLLKRHFPDIPVTEEFALEGIANRNSLPYMKLYGFGSPRTVMRGTLRYPGFSNLMHSFKSLGMLELSKTIYLPHWTSFVQECLALKTKDKAVSPLKMIGELISPEQIEPLHEALEWLNLIPPTIASASPISMPLLPNSSMAPLDLFAYLLAHKLQYKPHERDMVILSHEIIARSRVQQSDSHSGKEPDMEVYTSKLITYGTPRASAMARTVGLPVAIAALRILDGKVDVRGAAKPDHESVYEPVLRGLEEVGLGMEESVSVGVGWDGSMGGGRFTVESKLIEAFTGTEIEQYHTISH